jgi:sucrose phosphorylase
MRALRNAVQLITYADRLGGTLAGLRALLADDGPLGGLFGGVHVLPFFTPYDGADAGFDPVDHLTVDPRLGTWEDVRALGDGGLDVMVDVIVNHVSVGSREFQAVVAGSGDAGMFLTMSSVFGDGATEAALLRVYRPRPGLPFTPVTLGGHERRLFWTTFTSEQVDIDVRHPRARAYLSEILRTLAASGARLVRLDAVGYAVKTPGTSCFMTDETVAFIDDLRAEAAGLGLQVLVEVHSHFEVQRHIADHADLVYDFALPPLVLHALGAGDTAPLQHWLEIRPSNAITVLDTHDGIGVVDVGADQTDPSLTGLLDAGQIDALVEGIHTASRGGSKRATGAAASNVDLYQVNCTFFDALGGDDDAYVVARLLQVFIPGVPQIYYVGLLAGGNDLELLTRTGVGRDVNRHVYGPGEVEREVARPVVQRLFALIRFRNAHPAFAGAFTWRAPGGSGRELELAWATEDGARATLWVDVAAKAYRVVFTDGAGGAPRTVTDVLDLPAGT